VGWLEGKIMFQLLELKKISDRIVKDMIEEIIDAGTQQLLKAFNQNRLVKHLMDNCCQTY
jgi:hypothetical protein